MVTWAFGEEREVSPGNYATLLSQHKGWVLWSFETIAGKYAAAAKAAIGNLPPQPLGVGQALYGQTPFVYINEVSNPRAHFRGLHGEQMTEFRVTGDRFMQTIGRGGFDPIRYDDEVLEVIVRSMPGPRSCSKIVEERAEIDMSGVGEVLAAAREIKGRKNLWLDCMQQHVSFGLQYF